MKVLIVSDTHRNEDNLIEVLEREKNLDLLIHCGDVEGAEHEIEHYAGCDTGESSRWKKKEMIRAVEG